MPIQKAEPTIPMSVASVVNKAMQLTVDNRYQSPGAMVADLRTAERKLRSVSGARKAMLPATLRRSALRPIPGRSVMVVESDARRSGLVPRRFQAGGLSRLGDRRSGSRGQSFSPRSGGCRLRYFQRAIAGGKPRSIISTNWGEDPRTQAVPAVLLLDEPQRNWKSQAQTARHRLVLSMPITMKQLRTVLAQLTTAKDAAGTNA